jgi:hypothetical protein
MGCLHANCAEAPAGRQCHFLATDHTGKAAFAGLRPRATRRAAAGFRRCVLDKLPCQVHTVLTDHEVPFALQPPPVVCGRARFCPPLPGLRRGAPPDPARAPWPHGPAGNTNRPIAAATAQRRRRCQTADERNEQPPAFLPACKHAGRLETLRGPTPHACGYARQKAPTILYPGPEPPHTAIIHRQLPSASNLRRPLDG